MARRSRRGVVSEPRMFPAYVRAEINNAITYGARHHYNSWKPPRWVIQDAIDHFVQPSDVPILKRAIEVCPNNNQSRVFRQEIEVDGWVTRLGVNVPDTQIILWPEQPTRECPMDTPQMVAVHEWAEHRRDAATAWMLVEGLIDEFDHSAQAISVLRDLWPDFDMLLHCIPGRKLDREVEAWLEKFHSAPAPRRVTMPVPDCMDLLEDARSTVLSMTLMPADLPVRESDELTVTLYDSKAIQVPWYEWAMTVGRPGVIPHHLG
jgi:hypothetical protein